MNERLVKLEDEIYSNGIEVITYDFKSNNIKAMCSNNLIAISPKVTDTREKICILAEELAHIKINTGDISDNQKEELKARRIAYKSLIGLKDIISSFLNGCTNVYEMANFLEVTETFLKEALQWYKSKYGISTVYEDYEIKFIPNLSINKIA